MRAGLLYILYAAAHTRHNNSRGLTDGGVKIFFVTFGLYLILSRRGV